MGRLLDFTRTVDARRIPIKQQSQQDFGCNRLPTLGSISLVDFTQVQLAYHIDYKAGQVCRWQRFFQTDRLFQGFFIIRISEFSAHAYSVLLLFSSPNPLSDKLLV